MTREIELKFPVADLEPLRRAVLRAGGRYAGTVLQTDCYFDTPQQTLTGQDRGLRLRTSQRINTDGTVIGQDRPIAMGRLSGQSYKSGKYARPTEDTSTPYETPNLPALVTYKGPRSLRGRAKSRREIQTHVADPRAVEEMLTELGLGRRFVIQKRRSTYRLGGCLVELDELPILGSFVEIEGASTRAIEAVARKLGLEGQPTKAGYVHLAAEACRRAGSQCTEVTFRRRQPRRGSSPGMSRPPGKTKKA
jgi:adenylate cyclase class IV